MTDFLTTKYDVDFGHKSHVFKMAIIEFLSFILVRFLPQITNNIRWAQLQPLPDASSNITIITTIKGPNSDQY